MEDNAHNANEPDPAYVVGVGNTWSKVPSDPTLNYPNRIESDAGEGGYSSSYQTSIGFYHWRTYLNWEPAKGRPLIGTGVGAALNQTPEEGRYYGENFTSPLAGGSVAAATWSFYNQAHPTRFGIFSWFGMTRSADLCWQMEGGHAPGGSWLDNQITCNPPHALSNYRIIKPAWGQVQPSAFRVSAALAKSILPNTGPANAAAVDMEYIVVDATRCQNGEELATVIGNAINEHPGGGALKAMGGTFMPSMGNAMRQDRTGWVVLTADTSMYSHVGLVPVLEAEAHPASGSKKYIDALRDSNVWIKAACSTQAIGEQLPASGWLRTTTGGRNLQAADSGPIDVGIEEHINAPAFAPYHSREVYQDATMGGAWVVKFNLAKNRITGLPLFEDALTYHYASNNKKVRTGGSTANNISVAPIGNPAAPAPIEIAIWTKAGVHRYNNHNTTARDHMCQVHFSGLIDALDRTRPIGAMGWAGERYSYLNSLKIGTEGYAAGKGAWHPKLGFSPYGSASSCLNSLSQMPYFAPLQYRPDNSDYCDDNSLLTHPYSWTVFTPISGYKHYNGSTHLYGYTMRSVTDGDGDDGWVPPHKDFVGSSTKYLSGATTKSVTHEMPPELYNPQNLYSRAMLVVSYESELPLVAKRDRDGITATGDWLAVVSKTRNSVAAATAITFAGTTQWDERIHDPSRFTAPATAGPNVEALIATGTAIPTIANDASLDASPFNARYHLHSAVTADTALFNAEPCLNNIGDLFFDLDKSPGSLLLEDYSSRPLSAKRNINHGYPYTSGSTGMPARFGRGPYWIGDVNGYDTNYQTQSVKGETPAKNFSVEHVVWKRMDGGNLSLPASNARGLGAVPWITRVVSNTPHVMGEKLLGNCRFSFETTNSAMFPVIQAQELSHPQLAARHPDALRNVLMIPNEEIQFEEIQVTDDTGQVHIVEGGSPLGTVIRAFRTLSDRGTEGLAPSESNSGLSPNLKIQLPNPDSIPGNLVVRSGFDPIQSYQTETIGGGGMLHPNMENSVKHLFNKSTVGPRLGPSFGNLNWEHISQETGDIAFPDSSDTGWEIVTNNNPLKTSYELHDRTLFFHITKSRNTHTHRYPTTYTHAAGVVNNDLTAASYSGTTLTVNTSINTTLFGTGFGESEVKDGRRFLRLYNPNTGKGGVASYTSISGSEFRGCVGDAEFDTLVAGTVTALKVVPSYYIPAGSSRFYAARRLRDHAEVSGASPDMAHTQYFDGVADFTVGSASYNNDPTITHASSTAIRANMLVSGSGIPTGAYVASVTDATHFELSVSTTGGSKSGQTLTFQTPAYEIYKKPKLTPMPIPRMGHHYITPTMAMLPGHWAHPAYQGVYDKHRACRSSTKLNVELAQIKSQGKNTPHTSFPSTYTDTYNPISPPLHFGALNATPSGPSDIHGGAFTLMFESKMRNDGYGILASKGQAGTVNAAGSHTIVLEAAANYTLNKHFPDPSEVGAYQIVIQPNLHSSQLTGFHANGSATGLPDGSVEELTSQQVALVIGISENYSRHGGLALILADATMADVRGCEVFVNELMIDLDPDHASQFTNIPPLMLYNALGVQGTESPAFTRVNSFPYHPGMFTNATPAFTTNIPWWSILHHVGPDDASAVNFRHWTQYQFDDYYDFCRANAGAIGGQITLGGYPSIYPDIYSPVLENVSRTPRATVTAIDLTGAQSWNPDSTRVAVRVDNAHGFLEKPYFGQKIEFVDSGGERRTMTYHARTGVREGDMNSYDVLLFDKVGVVKSVTLGAGGSGYTTADTIQSASGGAGSGATFMINASGGALLVPRFIRAGGTGYAVGNTLNIAGGTSGTYVVATITQSDKFFANMVVGNVLRLSREYDFRPAGSIFKDSLTSIATRTLPQTLQGSRDTNSLHMGDAFLSLWHPNLGRPHTFYSDSSRTWANPTNDRAVDAKPYNMMPEHFETVHYHDATYYASMGPFGFHMKTQRPPVKTGAKVMRIERPVQGDGFHALDGKADPGSIMSIEYDDTSMTNGGVCEFSTSITVGSGYSTGDYDLTGGTGYGARVRIHAVTGGGALDGGLAKISIIWLGAGYSVNDTLTLVGGNNNAVLTVTKIGFHPHYRLGGSNNGAYADSGGTLQSNTQYGRHWQHPPVPISAGNKFLGWCIGASQRHASERHIVIANHFATKYIFNPGNMYDGGLTEKGAELYIGGEGNWIEANEIDSLPGYTAQGGAFAAGSDTKTMLNKFWPSGSRGGPLVSRLDGYAYVSSAWSYPRQLDFNAPVWEDQDDDGSYTVVNGIRKVDYSSTHDGSGSIRTRPFGYRFGLRQPYNRPRWSLHGARGYIEAITPSRVSSVTVSAAGSGYSAGTKTTSGGSGSGCTVSITVSAGGITGATVVAAGTGYLFGEELTVAGGSGGKVVVNRILTTGHNGPLVQNETQTWTYDGGSGLANVTYPNTYAGIMERRTNFSGMLAGDKAEWQVRYSEGRRMTRPFGCPVRTLRNTNNVSRDWWGDGEGKNLSTIDQIAGYYIVDWWGNTRGEDVRKYPVRGFGIRPAWDCGNAYEYDRTNGRTPFERILNDEKPIFNMKNVVAWNGTTVSVTNHYTLPRFGGTLNDDNNNNTDKLVDVFAPTHSMRVGDMGNGRGVRYPTQFNEDVLTALNEPTRSTGLVLSHNTAEPPIKNGFIRPRDDILQTDELPRGISSRLDIAEDGLLKPEATVSDRTELITGDSPHKDPISRSSPRIGIEADNVESTEANIVVINTEAHSLHTDRNVGQRIVLQGGMQSGSQTLAHYDLTELSFAGQPQGGVMRFSHTNPFTILGGTYVLEAKNYMKYIDDTGWSAIPASGMVLWLKADAIVGTADGGDVPIWEDVSGNMRMFSQDTDPAKIPTYVASDSDFNNMPTIRFDGGDKLEREFDVALNTNEFTTFVVAAVNADNNTHEAIFESRSSYDFTLTGISLTNTDATVTHTASPIPLVVGMPVSGPGIAVGAEIASITDPTHFELTAGAIASSTEDITISVVRAGFNLYGDMTGGTSGGSWEFWAGAAESWRALGSGVGAAALTTGESAILTAQISGGDGIGASATQLFRVDGTQIGTQSCLYYKAIEDPAGIGTMNTSSYMLDGEIAEIIHYNRALSTEEMKRVEGYLGTKYGISGTAGFKTSNPYETASFPATKQTNYTDKSIKFLVRPVRMLDKQHVEIFRPNNSLHSSSPQYGPTAYSATAGGKYGIFAYEMPNARASSVYMRGSNPDTNPPYVPVYRIVPGASETVPMGVGPKILGAGMADFDKTTIGTTVSRLVISENTLQHHRSDASRRRTIVTDDEVEYQSDFNVQPRFSQSLHPKGHKGDVSFNTSDHSGDAT